MIIYNKHWLENIQRSKEAKKWRKSKLISEEQYLKIKSDFNSPFYTPVFFIRLTLFVFTCIGLSAASSFCMLIFSPLLVDLNLKLYGVFMIAMGVITYLILEKIIHIKNLYKAGIDDALLYTSLGLIISGTSLTFLQDYFDGLILCIISLPLLVWAVIRFGDMLLTLAGFLCFMTIVFLSMVELGPVAKKILPFAGIIISSTIYYLSKKINLREDTWPWRNCLLILEILSLLSLYLSGNYLVVRELSIMLMNVVVTENNNIPLAMLFYIFTVLIPVIYIYSGIIKKDHILLRVGLLTLALAVFTFKYYYSLGRHEITLICSGILLLASSILSIKILKNQPKGFTSKQLLKQNFEETDLEGLLVSQTMPSTSIPQKTEFGGGEFGGGGSSSKW